MPIQCELNTELRFKGIVFSERVTAKEFAEYSETLTPEEMSQYDVAFVDFGQMTGCDFGFDFVFPHSDRVSLRGTQGPRLVEIIWAPSDVAFGMARMYQSLVGEEIDVQLFRDESEAREAVSETLKSLKTGGEVSTQL